MNRRARGAVLSGGFLALLLTWLVVYPIGIVAVDAVRGAQGFTLDGFRDFVARANEWRALWGSLWISFATVVLSACIGVPLAVFFTRYDFPGRRVLAQLVALPAVLPPLVGVLSFLFLWGETGFAARLVQQVTGSIDPPWRLQGAGAILFVQAYSMYVYFYLFVRAGLRGIDASAYEAAESLGATRWRTFTKVVLPLLRPSLAGAAFAGVSLRPRFIQRALPLWRRVSRHDHPDREHPPQWRRPPGHGGNAGPHRDRAGGPRAGALGGCRRPDRGVQGCSSGSAADRVPARPDAALLRRLAGGRSSSCSRMPRCCSSHWCRWGPGRTRRSRRRYTLGNYVTLVSDPVRARPLLTSLWMAIAATVGAVAIGLGVGALVVRRRVPTARFLEWLVALPWAVPGTVFAIALATAFSVHAPVALRFILVGTPVILPLAYLVRNLPLSGRALLAGYRRLDPSYEEAAASLGAGGARTMRRVVIPLLALVAGGRCDARVRGRLWRFRDQRTAVHLRHAAHLPRDPGQPALE